MIISAYFKDFEDVVSLFTLQRLQ